jgi:hypothetical protein
MHNELVRTKAVKAMRLIAVIVTEGPVARQVFRGGMNCSRPVPIVMVMITIAAPV